MHRASIELLTDREILNRLDDLVCCERGATLDILRHLALVDRRRLWRGEGYRSIHDYCRRRLRYSEAAAHRRIRAARVLGRHAEVAERVADGRISVCGLSRIARLVLDEGRVDLLDAIEGQTLDEIDTIVAATRPLAAAFPARIRVAVVAREAPGSISSRPTAGDRCVAIRSEPDTAAGPAPMAKGTPPGPARPPVRTLERVYRFEFPIDARAMQKFARAQSMIAARRSGPADLPAVFSILLDEFLDRHDPLRRDARRRARGRANNVDATAVGVAAGRAVSPRPRHVPLAVRDAVFARDQGRCTFVGPDGTRCDANERVEVDHIVPFAAGGTHAPDNLRLLCAAHNALAAERAFGAAHMSRYVRGAAG